MADLFDLTGKVALVTGGCGMIGSAISLALAQAGADIAVADIKLDKYEQQAAKIRATGRKTIGIAVDVTQEKSVADMVATVLKTFPRLDLLLNIHGIAIRKPSDVMPIEDWQRVMDINLRGTMLTCQAAARVMIKQKSGKIINMSSVRGRFGFPGGYAAYSPSKGGVDSLTRTLAVEWAPHNVTVNAMAPTFVNSELTQTALANPEFKQLVMSRIPLGRLATTDDIVGLAVFLASKASDFITGQIIYLDGGTTCW